MFEKGTSARIWGELYKVLDSSDVVLQILDARDPIGTRSSRLEAYLKKEASHKHLILVLNKTDLVSAVLVDPNKVVRHSRMCLCACAWQYLVDPSE